MRDVSSAQVDEPPRRRWRWVVLFLAFWATAGVLFTSLDQFKEWRLWDSSFGGNFLAGPSTGWNVATVNTHSWNRDGPMPRNAAAEGHVGGDWEHKLLLHTSVSLKYIIGIEYLLASFALSQDLERTKLIIWIDQGWTPEPGSYTRDVFQKYGALPWVDFAEIEVKELMKGSCYENRSEWLHPNSDKARRINFPGRFWSDLLRIGLLWRWGGFWVDADTMLFFDFQPYAQRHHDNFMVGCNQFDINRQPLKDVWCLNEIVMAQSASVRAQMMEFACMVGVDFEKSIMTRPAKPHHILRPEELKEKTDWVEEVNLDGQYSESLQDLWNAGIMLLCQIALHAGAPEGRRCNPVWFPVEYVDGTYFPGNGLHLPLDKHPVYQFCESDYYSPEIMLHGALDRFRRQPLQKFLESDDVPLLVHTHQKYCRTHRAKPAGFMRVFGRRLEFFLGKDFAYVQNAPVSPTNWAFLRSDEIPYVLAPERRDYNNVQLIVVSPPGHSEARARWRTLVGMRSRMTSPFERASRLTGMSFVVPFTPGQFPENGPLKQNGLYPDGRLEAEHAVFDDVHLVPGVMPKLAKAIETGARTKNDMLNVLRSLDPWLSHAIRVVVGRTECSVCVLVLDDGLFVSEDGIWHLIDNTLYNADQPDWIFFEGVFNARFQVGYTGSGVFMISRDTLGEISPDVPEGVRGRPDYWDVATSYGELEERTLTLTAAPGFPSNMPLRLILTRVRDKKQRVKKLKKVPEKIGLKFQECSGDRSELESWSDVLAIGAKDFLEPNDAIVKVEHDSGPMAVGLLGRFVAAATQAAASGEGISGPCLVLLAA
eukprot:NODE_758_length_2782_cov_14.598870.p1 GENE.NODE_758_length_2782_cov_14.598870~~NODE_758_length_2782_cov_14.598870.p1  ORF type:complete len:820 (+),score=159.47 NODE_758_length_2782_cov_14.598870:94-2553(+)